MLLIVHNTILSRGDSLDLIVRLNPIEVSNPADASMGKLWRMTNLEGDLLLILKGSPRIFRDKIESLHVDDLAILRLRIITVRDIDDIASDVFLNHKPRATTQTQSLALSDRMKPITIVLPHALACLQLHDLAGALASIALDKLIVVDLAQEADALTVFPFGTR